MNKSNRFSVLISCAIALGVCGCQQKTEAPAPAESAPAPAPVASNLKPVAGVQDVMAAMIDPAADFLWESVSTTVTRGKVEEHRPQTDAEWAAVRRQAIILTEGSNLLLMEGRHVVKEGGKLEDHGTEGNLSAEESDAAIKSNRETFVGFATALRGVGEQMLKAADTRDIQLILDAGDTMDQVCESCHLKFWYPGQKIPLFPDQAPEVDAAPKK
jgi:hypothetical protein